MFAESSIKVTNLACREVFGSHTAVNLQAWLLDVQKDFGLKDEQLLALTIDSAANITAAADGYIDEIQESINGDLNNDIDYIKVNNIDANIFAEISFEEDDEEDGDFQVEDHVAFSGEEVLPSIFRIHCAAHKLQLAVNAFLKLKAIQKILITARTLAVKLRTPLVRSKLCAENFRIPELDQVTRWNSTQVLELKNFCKSNQDKDITGEGFLLLYSVSSFKYFFRTKNT